MTSLRASSEEYEIIPPPWAADRPRTRTAAARSWAGLADLREAQANWCAMVLETRNIGPHARDMLRIEWANMIEGVEAYRLWSDLGRPFRDGP